MNENELKNIQVLNPIQDLRHRSLQFLQESLEWKSHDTGLGDDCAIKNCMYKTGKCFTKMKEKSNRVKSNVTNGKIVCKLCISQRVDCQNMKGIPTTPKQKD